MNLAVQRPAGRYFPTPSAPHPRPARPAGDGTPPMFGQAAPPPRPTQAPIPMHVWTAGFMDDTPHAQRRNADSLGGGWGEIVRAPTVAVFDRPSDPRRYAEEPHATWESTASTNGLSVHRGFIFRAALCDSPCLRPSVPAMADKPAQHPMQREKVPPGQARYHANPAHPSRASSPATSFPRYARLSTMMCSSSVCAPAPATPSPSSVGKPIAPVKLPSDPPPELCDAIW